MTSNFFETNNYFVDKISSFNNHYNIYNDKYECIGMIRQKFTAQQKMLRLIFGKTMLPFSIEIRSTNGKLESSISREGISLLSEIIVKNAQGVKVGVISKPFKFSKPEFKILNTSHKVIAAIGNAWHGPNFIVTDSAENQIGSIDEKKRRSMKNIISSAQSYNVSMMANYSCNEDKIAILSGAIIVNMFFFN